MITASPPKASAEAKSATLFTVDVSSVKVSGRLKVFLITASSGS